MTDTYAFLVFAFIAVLAFEAVNGWTDAPNAVATVISTRALPPLVAVAMAAVLNLVGALSGTAIATTIGKGIVDIEAITLETGAAAALAVVIWSGTAAYFGLPTSESHGIVSGIAGAAVAVAGTDVLLWDGWQKVFTGVGAAVVFGFGGAFLIGILILWLFLLGAGTMGLSTMVGGWRIIRTLGMRVTHLETYQGFAAEAAAATTLTVTARLGIPVSTTHTIGSGIMGVGSTRRLSAVRWGVAYNIIGAWILTFPVCFALGWLIATAIPD